MSGIRLRCTDPDMRGKLYLVEHPMRRYIVPKLCEQCKVVHVKKTYHLRLDGEGTIIVSDTIYDRLREAGMPALIEENEVIKPPHQRVGIEAPALVFGQNDRVVAKSEGGSAFTVVKNKLLHPRKRLEVRNY